MTLLVIRATLSVLAAGSRRSAFAVSGGLPEAITVAEAFGSWFSAGE